jgi:hypothetical protein
MSHASQRRHHARHPLKYTLAPVLVRFRGAFGPERLIAFTIERGHETRIDRALADSRLLVLASFLTDWNAKTQSKYLTL